MLWLLLLSPLLLLLSLSLSLTIIAAVIVALLPVLFRGVAVVGGNGDYCAGGGVVVGGVAAVLLSRFSYALGLDRPLPHADVGFEISEINTFQRT